MDQTPKLNTDLKTKPWQWPGEWFKDEKFWREVTARAMSGLIVALILYLFAVFGGYIKPLNLAWVATVWIGGMTLLFSLGTYSADWAMSKKFPDKRRFRTYALLKVLAIFVPGVILIGLVWFAAWLASLIWQ